jgi:hypothetical protein
MRLLTYKLKKKTINEVEIERRTITREQMRKEENERKTKEKTAPATEYSHDSETSLETPVV